MAREAGERAKSGWPLRHSIFATRACLFDAGAAAQVSLDLQPRAAAESGAVDLQVLHDPLHIVARLGEGNQLDPVDGVDLGVPRIAIALDPFLHAAAAGIVRGKG